MGEEGGELGEEPEEEGAAKRPADVAGDVAVVGRRDAEAPRHAGGTEDLHDELKVGVGGGVGGVVVDVEVPEVLVLLARVQEQLVRRLKLFDIGDRVFRVQAELGVLDLLIVEVEVDDAGDEVDKVQADQQLHK